MARAKEDDGWEKAAEDTKSRVLANLLACTCVCGVNSGGGGRKVYDF